jgi:hypothetical protein
LRQRTDPHEGFVYRVVERVKGSDDEWKHSNYGHSGRLPRTYMTLSAAKGQKTSFENQQVHALENEAHAMAYRSPEFIARVGWPSPELEFKVQRMPVDNWEDVD